MKILERRDEDIGLIGHVIGGYPDKKTCLDSLGVMTSSGVSLAEVQIPFSEPIADGPLFMQANHEALASGVTVEDSFLVVKSFANEIPLVVMTYANIVYAMGERQFIESVAKNGARGIIIPDWPVEIAQELLKACKDYGVSWIPIIPPNASQDRMRLLLDHGGGFVYAVARAGVTGQKSEFTDDLASRLREIREHSDLPIAVGFGVSSAEDVKQLKPIADYAIVGSAAMRALKAGGVAELKSFWAELVKAGK